MHIWFFVHQYTNVDIRLIDTYTVECLCPMCQHDIVDEFMLITTDKCYTERLSSLLKTVSRFVLLYVGR